MNESKVALTFHIGAVTGGTSNERSSDGANVYTNDAFDAGTEPLLSGEERSDKFAADYPIEESFNGQERTIDLKYAASFDYAGAVTALTPDADETDLLARIAKFGVRVAAIPRHMRENKKRSVAVAMEVAAAEAQSIVKKQVDFDKATFAVMSIPRLSDSRSAGSGNSVSWYLVPQLQGSDAKFSEFDTILCMQTTSTVAAQYAANLLKVKTSPDDYDPYIGMTSVFEVGRGNYGEVTPKILQHHDGPNPFTIFQMRGKTEADGVQNFEFDVTRSHLELLIYPMLTTLVNEKREWVSHHAVAAAPADSVYWWGSFLTADTKRHYFFTTTKAAEVIYEVLGERDIRRLGEGAGAARAALTRPEKGALNPTTQYWTEAKVSAGQEHFAHAFASPDMQSVTFFD